MFDHINPTVHAAVLPTDNATPEYTAADFWRAAAAGRVDTLTLIAMSGQKPLRDHVIKHLRSKYGIIVVVDLAPEDLDPAAEARRAAAGEEADACTCANCERGLIDAAP